MFLNDFFKIVHEQSGVGTVSSDIELNSNHEIFEGHFPGSPVTPGVVQLQIVKDILENHFHRTLRMRNMRSCKFLQILNPLETPNIRIDIKFVEAEFLEVIASGSYAENVYFKAQISYQ